MAAQSLLPTLLAVPVVGLLLFRRYRRAFGRQVFAPTRMVLRMLLLVVLAGMMLVTARSGPSFAAAAVGAVAGGVLGVVALRTTRLEVTPDGRFYTPNVWIGIVVTALFLGRLAARMVAFYMDGPPAIPAPQASPFDGLNRSPLTLGIIVLTAAYHVVYFAGVIRDIRRLEGKAEPHAGEEE